MNELAVGDYRLLLKGNKVFSIGLQQTVYFDKDIILEVINTTGSDSYFGKMKNLYFNNRAGYTPILTDNIHGQVTFEIQDTAPYTLPDFTLIK